MNKMRRAVLQSSTGFSVMALAAANGLFSTGAFAQAPAAAAKLVAEWNKAAFDTKSLQATATALGGGPAVESRDIIISAPDIAEDGRVVPLNVTSKLAKTEAIAILVEKNPSSLAANFAIPEGTEPFVKTAVKMGQSSNIHALVKADGKYYYATREVKVTLGGCGG
jgi:sulfur-oxidizing protein SoxY